MPVLNLSKPDVTAKAKRYLIPETRVAAITPSVLSIFDQMIVSGTSFLTAAIVGRSCAPTELGIYYLTLSIALVLVGIQQNLVGAPYTVLCHRREEEDLAEYAGSAWVHCGILIIVSTLLLVCAIAVLSRLDRVELLPGLTALAIAGPPLLLREAIRRFMFAHMQIMGVIAIDAAVSLLQIGTLSWLWYCDRLTVFWAFVVMGGACALACLGWILRRSHSPRFVARRLRQDWSHNWALGKWGLASYVIVDVIPYLMPWIIGLAAGAVTAGVFGACATLVNVTNVFVIGTGNLLSAKSASSFSSGGTRDLLRTLATTAALFFIVFSAVCLLFAWWGAQLAVFIFGERFSDTGPIIATLAANVLAGSLGLVAKNGLWAMGRPRAGLPADACMLVATVVLAWHLIGLYGAFGAALAALFGTCIGTGLKMIALYRAISTFHLQLESD